MAAALLPRLLRHWDGSSCLGLLISVFPSLLTALSILSAQVAGSVFLCRRCSCTFFARGNFGCGVGALLVVHFLGDACSIPSLSQYLDYVFAQSLLPYLHLMQTYKVLRHKMSMANAQGLGASYFCCHSLS